MQEAEQLKQDIHFVKQAVQRSACRQMPLGIAFVWAAYVLIGYTGLDLRPRWAGIFLMAAAPVAYLISMQLGLRSALNAGVSDRAEGMRHGLHWGSLFLAIASLAAMMFETRLPMDSFGQIIVIMVGLVYFLAGVHFGMRVLLWLGPLMMAGAVARPYFEPWGWTMLGVVIAAGIVAAGFRASRHG